MKVTGFASLENGKAKFVAGGVHAAFRRNGSCYTELLAGWIFNTVVGKEVERENKLRTQYGEVD